MDFFTGVGFRCPPRKGIPDFLQEVRPFACLVTGLCSSSPVWSAAVWPCPCPWRMHGGPAAWGLPGILLMCPWQRDLTVVLHNSAASPPSTRSYQGCVGANQLQAVQQSPSAQPWCDRSARPRTSSSTGSGRAPGSMCLGTPLWRPTAGTGQGRTWLPTWRSPSTRPSTSRSPWSPPDSLSTVPPGLSQCQLFFVRCRVLVVLLIGAGPAGPCAAS